MSYLHAHLITPHLNVQIAMRVHPGVPLIVANGTTDRATVLETSPHAREYGINTGMLVWAARRRCRMLHVIAHDPDAIAQAEVQMTDVLQRHSNAVRRVQGGWDFPLYGLGKQCSNAIQIAAQLHDDVVATTGLEGCVGLAAHPVMARIAAHVAAERDGSLVVLPGTEASFVAPLPIASLPGVGSQTEQALHKLGVRTAGQLADMPAAMLAQVCGTRGANIARIARGLPPNGLAPSVTIVRTWQSVNEPESDRRCIQQHLYMLTEQVGRELRRQTTAAGTITVGAGWTDGVHRHKAVHWSSRSDLDRQLTVGSSCALDELLAERRLAIVSLWVAASDLGPIQHGLLLDDDSRVRQLQTAVDSIKARYGDRAILPAALFGMRGASERKRA